VEDAARDAARRELAARGLTPVAVAHLTRDALGRIELDHLAPVKGLLKQFFSDALWTTDDDDAFAALVGPGQGWWHHELDEGFDLDFGWRQGRFRLEVAPTASAALPSDEARTRTTPRLLDENFEGAIVPEATPNPRTIRFVTGPIHSGPSRWYESAGRADDPHVARLFEEFDDVANVLVGPDFVAVGIRRADRWEELLGPMLRVLEVEFPTDSQAANDADGSGDVVDQPSIDVRATSPHRAERSFDRSWRELRALQLDDDDDVDLLLRAVSSQEIATRQAAARVLLDADPDVARTAWSDLLADPSPTVRRATVDAMVDAARPALRSLFEQALADRDAWTRWKALRGLVDLGVEPSRNAVTLLAADTDFRVRLEATAALRGRDRG
jgi:hypothetical protein